MWGGPRDFTGLNKLTAPRFTCLALCTLSKSGPALDLNLLPTGVLQIPALVASLGRLGPSMFTALRRKRRVAQPVRFNVTEVALWFVTM